MSAAEQIIDEEQNERFKLLVMTLNAKLGRLPTEEEVFDFIMGTKKDRERIWNLEDID